MFDEVLSPFIILSVIYAETLGLTLAAQAAQCPWSEQTETGKNIQHVQWQEL